ncbi:hypothetical protein B0186_07850 [Canicola haemoglobinophilus]|uniref:Uncharacterized protein involved in outer membrane biogenesis n=1 Tax=Canicola haemoglobinophilus TaxID=733 RepID=A0A1V4B017_9PAST|nr:hypothetical protein [Canicola haemoglobinophilus]OOR99369.1 hypothetical protein B0186_07850 [Canicola haemoglobinophilus]STO53584.1 Uncharacterized protein involved in outer membrane biogenesis [Canicola haemoglobinophilus]STO61009.1 Uncharacterized protein involved in outer membrane biogenesis [Canicola haemoglobinophilus]STO68118.1 Uncharacterized protein involved in outer membrane biogenesis [Canicola haemoglobinophilus]
MWKKISLLITALSLGMAIFTYVQIGKIQSTLVKKLKANQMEVDKISIEFFPAKIALTNLQYAKFSYPVKAETTNIQIDIGTLLTGELALNNVVLNKITSTSSSFPSIQQLSILGKIKLQQNKAIFDDVLLDLQFAQSLYLDKSKFNFHIIKGVFQRDEMAHPKFEADMLINQQPVSIVADIKQLADEQKILTLLFKDQKCTPCSAELKYTVRLANSLFTQGFLQFNSHEFPIEHWLKMANLSPAITGKAEIFANGIIQEGKLTKLDMPIGIKQGTLSSINLLELASGILPINYDKENAPKDMPFSQLQLNSNCDGKLLYLNDISMLTEQIMIEGKGTANLAQMQCDVNLTLRPTNEKYQHASLAIHFFDQCNRPQYKLKIQAKDSLKQLLKQKFSH